MTENISVDFSDYCRTCAIESKHLHNLYHNTEHNKTFAEIINVCMQFSFQEYELRSKYICTNCVMKLNSAYDFYRLVQSSEEKFKALVSSQLQTKLEETIIDDVNESKYPLSIQTESHNVEPSADELSQLNIKSENIFVDEPDVDLINEESESSITLEDLKVEIQRKRRRSIPRKPDEKPTEIKRPFNISKSITEFECYMCKLSFSSLHKLKLHFKDHDATTKCRICVIKFNKLDYVKHLCWGTEIQCQYCSKYFNTTVSLVKHINRNHKNHHNYKCYKCAKAFPMKALLDIHRPSHNKESKRFTCDICGNRYRTRFQIREHIETMHTDNRSFLCATCGKSFKNPTTLRAHVSRHTPTKPVACPKCPKRFFDKYGLKKHIEVHNEAEFICDICGAVMRSKGSYMEHKRRHKNTKVYTCEICSKQIKTSLYNLKLHLYTHTGEKPFKCTYCDRRYTQNADLNKHLRTHVGQNTYKCDICDKSYRLLRELRKHSSEHYVQSLANKGSGSSSKDLS